jgi:hypothetical protein
MESEPMHNDHHHIPDEELLLMADGELAPRRAALVRAHLEACWDCRARMAEMRTTIFEFTQAHRQSFDPQLPPIAGPRALLRAGIAELDSRRWFHQITSFTRVACLGASLCILALLGSILFRHRGLRAADAKISSAEHSIVPDPRLTPGATRMIAIDSACSMTHEEVIKDVPRSLRREVLHEYKIADSRQGAYEIDYLIAPGLGGTDDIRNLWPEPYDSQWNAYVKDALEERLHQLVCTHKLDLDTAQHDIAANWIEAYKKYFHTDRPIYRHSGSTFVSELKRPGTFPEAHRKE